MIYILTLYLVLCCVGINCTQVQINVQPRLSCGDRFCNTADDYPMQNITKLVVDHPAFIHRTKEIGDILEITNSKTKITRQLCDCALHTISPQVGLNVYNQPRFIVNLEKEYRQSLQTCQRNLTDIKHFKNTPCAKLRAVDNNSKPMCLPKYQSVLLNVVNNHSLFLDEFYVVSMYKCVFVPRDGII